jgi:hypothetical protein
MLIMRRLIARDMLPSGIAVAKSRQKVTVGAKMGP